MQQVQGSFSTELAIPNGAAMVLDIAGPLDQTRFWVLDSLVAYLSAGPVSTGVDLLGSGLFLVPTATPPTSPGSPGVFQIDPTGLGVGVSQNGLNPNVRGIALPLDQFPIQESSDQATARFCYNGSKVIIPFGFNIRVILTPVTPIAANVGASIYVNGLIRELFFDDCKN